MKEVTKIWIYSFAIMGVFLMIISGCKKKSDESAVTGPVPVVVTGSHSNLLLNTVHFSGNITSDGGVFVTQRGFCWSKTNQNPSIQNDTLVSSGSGTGSFSGDIKGLRGQTSYYLRAYAINSNGTGYGSIKHITTIDTTIDDADNNSYRVIQLGLQVWMVENLKTTKFNDGTIISLVTDSPAWNSLSTSGYCWYNNDAATYKVTCGGLYNWYAVNTGKLCPTGWHVPTDVEWTTLATYLGGDLVAGGKMKSTGTIEEGTGIWHAPNTGATNESGFTAVPAGYRHDYGDFSDIGNYSYWWCSTENITGTPLCWLLSNNSSSVTLWNNFPQYGFSVRCIRNN
jgi:uncharacterized protein (TIGR02145 family)